jgi:uncharacterized protein (DUF1684 family)
MLDSTNSALESYAALWDWRRRVAEIYRQVCGAADPRSAWEAWRRARDQLFAEHPQTPVPAQRRREFRGLGFFPYDPDFRFEIELQPAVSAEPQSMVAGADGKVTLLPFARTFGLEARLGGELTLFWIAGYGGGVFLPFLDATSGRDTYAGGRYLLDTIKGADLGTAGGRAVLDFNFAYNPSCSYSERWVCPLAPATNRVPASVTAGERIPIA